MVKGEYVGGLATIPEASTHFSTSAILKMIYVVQALKKEWVDKNDLSLTLGMNKVNSRVVRPILENQHLLGCQAFQVNRSDPALLGLLFLLGHPDRPSYLSKGGQMFQP